MDVCIFNTSCDKMGTYFWKIGLKNLPVTEHIISCSNKTGDALHETAHLMTVNPNLE